MFDCGTIKVCSLDCFLTDLSTIKTVRISVAMVT